MSWIAESHSTSACSSLSTTPLTPLPLTPLPLTPFSSHYHSPQDVRMTESIHELDLTEHLLASFSALVHFQHHYFTRALVIHLQTVTQWVTYLIANNRCDHDLSNNSNGVICVYMSHRLHNKLAACQNKLWLAIACRHPHLWLEGCLVTEIQKLLHLIDL